MYQPCKRVDGWLSLPPRAAGHVLPVAGSAAVQHCLDRSVDTPSLELNRRLSCCSALDITHPIPDLTGYITEGQVFIDRPMHNKQVRLRNAFLVFASFFCP